MYHFVNDPGLEVDLDGTGALLISYWSLTLLERLRALHPIPTKSFFNIIRPSRAAHCVGHVSSVWQMRQTFMFTLTLLTKCWLTECWLSVCLHHINSALRGGTLFWISLHEGAGRAALLCIKCIVEICWNRQDLIWLARLSVYDQRAFSVLRNQKLCWSRAKLRTKGMTRDISR